MTEHDNHRITRRDVLTLVGGVGLAGCTDVPFVGSDEQSVEFNGTAISNVPSNPVKLTAAPMPVSVKQAYIDEKVSRVRSMLDSIPGVLGPEEIPNGAARQQLSKHQTDAETSLREATQSSRHFDGLDELRNARREARYVAATWRAIQGNLARDTVTEQTPRVRNRFNTARDRHQYMGNDPVQAVLVHASIDQRFATARRSMNNKREEGESQLPVFVTGTLAATNERVRANIDDAMYLYERFQQSLSTQRGLQSVFERTATAIENRIRQRQQELPDVEHGGKLVERDVSDTQVGMALERLYADVTDGFSLPSGEPTKIAHRILRDQRQLAYLIALETLQNRVEDGETYAIESADDLRERRSQAIAIVRRVRGVGQYPRLRQQLLEQVTNMIEGGDKELRDVSDSPSYSNISYPAEMYLRGNLVAEAIPNATRQVGNQLAKRTP